MIFEKRSLRESNLSHVLHHIQSHEKKEAKDKESKEKDTHPEPARKEAKAQITEENRVDSPGKASRATRRQKKKEEEKKKKQQRQKQKPSDETMLTLQDVIIS